MAKGEVMDPYDEYGRMKRPQDATGLVEEGLRRVAIFGRFLNTRINRTLATMDIEEIVERAVNKRVKEEVDAIMEKRIAKLRPLMEAIRPLITLDDVLVAVTAATGQQAKDLLGPRRSRRFAYPRFLFIGLAREVRPELSFPKIGGFLGRRDHTSIMHGLKQFNRYREQEPFKEWLEHPAVVSLLEMPR